MWTDLSTFQTVTVLADQLGCGERTFLPSSVPYHSQQLYQSHILWFKIIALTITLTLVRDLIQEMGMVPWPQTAIQEVGMVPWPQTAIQEVGMVPWQQTAIQEVGMVPWPQTAIQDKPHHWRTQKDLTQFTTDADLFNVSTKSHVRSTTNTETGTKFSYSKLHIWEPMDNRLEMLNTQRWLKFQTGYTKPLCQFIQKRNNAWIVILNCLYN